MRCQSCNVMHIQGVRVHERGCPDAHRDEIRDCEWCGSQFSPADGSAKFCSTSCHNSFNNLPDPDDMDIPDEDILVAVVDEDLYDDR